MKRLLSFQTLIAVLVSMLATASMAAAQTRLNPGANLTAAVEAAAVGATIELNPGTYTPSATPGFPSGAFQFAIHKRVRIVGCATTAVPCDATNPSAVTLSAPAPGATVYAVAFPRYAIVVGPVPDPSGATLENLTIVSGASGVNISISQGLRLSNITLKNVVISATAGSSFGVVLDQVDRIALEGVQVSSSATAFYANGTTETLLINSSVVSTSGNNSNALAILLGQRNVVVNNILGSQPGTPTGVTINGGAVNLYNTQNNRVELNTVQGHRDDGINLHNTNVLATQQTLDNYVAKNVIISNGWAAGRGHGTPIWVNCSANNSWVYGNDVQGGPEAGLALFLSKANMFLGNVSHANEDAGVFVSGGPETIEFCPVAAYQVKPNRNYLFSNALYHNKIDSAVIRTSDNTDFVSNFISPKSAFGGVTHACTAPTDVNCQSAFALESNVFGARLLRNTSDGTNRGLWVNDGTTTGLEFFGNRMLGSTLNRLVTPSSSPNLDWGSRLGGNHWSHHPVSGNPSTTPFTNISFSSSSSATNGPASDRFPFGSETVGASTVTIAEPVAGDYARGSARTVRWYAPGCTYVDLTLNGVSALKQLDGTALPTHLPNTGYRVVRIPSDAAVGSHTVMVSCRNSLGVLTDVTASSPAFNVTSNNLTLLSPGRDDAFNGGQEIWASWQRASGFTGAVTVELSTDGGATYPTLLASGVTANFVRVTLPNIASTNNAMVRITSGASVDTTDGRFAIRGASGAGFTNYSSGRAFAMGQIERLEWASPQDSRLVTITYVAGGASGSVATDLPDRGYFDWVVPDLPTGTLNLNISYLTSTGATILTAASNSGSTTVPAQSLQVTKTGNGTVTGSGISCGSQCSATYPLGTVVTLTATAASESVFSGWTGSCTGSSSTCNVTMDSAKGVTAVFDTGALITRYRLYNVSLTKHLYTTNFNEYSILPVCCAWIPEGAIYRVFQGPGSMAGVTAVPYYRLYNRHNFQHHWTTDFVEYSFLPSVGWTQEGVDGYILPSAAAGSVPLYRLFYPSNGRHLWTTDTNERNFLIGSAGWADEGIAGYVVPLQ